LSERLDVEPRLVEAAARDVQSRLQRRRAPVYDGGGVPEGPEAPPDVEEASWKADLDRVPMNEREMLRAVFEHPEWHQPLQEICASEELRDARIRALIAAIAACAADGVAVEAGNVLSRCELPGCEPLLSRVRLHDGVPLDWDAARNCALGIHDDSLRRRLRQMTNDIREALAAGDHERFSRLNREKVSLAQQIGSA
jgi:hypothetical protein